MTELSAAPEFLVVLRGYDRAQIDALVGSALEALRAPDRPDLRASFAQALREPLLVRLRGYDRAQVDTYLSRLAATLGVSR
jgi:DivIVA domain-containing protein